MLKQAIIIQEFFKRKFLLIHITVLLSKQNFQTHIKVLVSLWDSPGVEYLPTDL